VLLGLIAEKATGTRVDALVWQRILDRYERPDGTVAFGHHGGVPGYTTVALRTAGGRTIVLCQNGIDLHDVLTSDTPLVAAALAGG
jgi:hypothetical protein